MWLDLTDEREQTWLSVTTRQELQELAGYLPLLLPQPVDGRGQMGSLPSA